MLKRTLVFLVCGIILVLSCGSCGLFGDQKYVCKAEDVAFIQIVRLDEYIEGEYQYEYTVLSQIENVESFVEQLNGINHSVNWGDPHQMDEGYVVIKIDYTNGNFDLIHPAAQCFHKNGTNNYGYFFFDDKQFDALISGYISK